MGRASGAASRKAGFVRRVLCLVVLLCAARAGFARVDPPHPAVDPRNVSALQSVGVIDLTSTWLLKQGDDPKYASPALDDSQWTVVKAGVPLKTYGMKNVDLVWYRTHVRLPAEAHDLAILLRGFAGSEDVFVNDVKVGSSGPFRQAGRGSVDSVDRIDRIPDVALANRELTIAIRASIGRSSARGGHPGGLVADSAVLLGGAAELANAKSLYTFRAFTSNATNLALASLLLLIAATLSLALRSQREYLALVGYLATVVCAQLAGILQAFYYLDYLLPAIVVQIVLKQSSYFAMLEFVRLVLGLERTRAFVLYEWLLFAVAPLEILAIYHFSTAGAGIPHSGATILTINFLFYLVDLPIDAGLPLLALGAWRKRRSPDALLLFVPLFVQAAFTYLTAAGLILLRLHVVNNFSLGLVPIPWLYVGWAEVTVFLFSIALLVFLILRTLRLARLQAANAAEIAAAQSVQQMLLSRASQSTPGFRVESVYLPANQVGGDFFLVSPGPDGSLIAIVGDVSGKGLTAAMRVSMILGALRREWSREPDSILRGLNEALLSQGEIGFTTACCLRMDREGNYRVANAGHISPYVDGEEIVALPSLPLGLAGNQEFGEISGRLPPGKRIVLMSDGVVEARSSSGELYGFDRLPALTRMPATDIADVAQRFGQDDDITVLTIACAI